MVDGERPVPRDHRVHDYRMITHAHDGSIHRVEQIQAYTDAEAIAQVDASTGEFAIDLWDGLRFVDHFAARMFKVSCALSALEPVGKT